MSEDSGNREYEVPVREFPPDFRIGNKKGREYHPSNFRSPVKASVQEAGTISQFKRPEKVEVKVEE